MNLGVQYYRPPFPVQKHWSQDLRRIRESGIDTLQLWVTWAWVESRPGQFEFSDYDRLVDLAHEAGLSVLLSTIAELQPHWIHEVVPGSEMIDNYGHRVVSSLREESNFGLTPGGCTEHPAVWDRMSEFLVAVVTRYRSAPHLAGWDAWNELRWHEQSDALVCYCPHCLREFHAWLEARYGGLEGVNQAWQRRYHGWSEVQPGKLPWRPFTEMMAWQRFVTWKANRHGRRRYELIKALDPLRAVTVHAGDPSPVTCGGPQAFAIDRGNDWHYADELDGVGCSSFPSLFGMDNTAFTTRVEFARSAAASAGKQLWLSEVQGGRGSLGFKPTAVVTAEEQQRWVWRGAAAGASKLLFWCWRDEIFGRESAGFGLAGDDGQAKARLAAMTRSGAVLRQHADFFAGYQPDSPRVGVFFSPSTYYLHWSLEGKATTPREALEGYCRALVELSIPYTVVEEEHLDALDTLQVLFLPRLLVAGEAVEAALARFVRLGGTLVCEAECGAFTSEGFYRYPEERFLTDRGLLPGREVGRRELPAGGVLEAGLPDLAPLRLAATQWITPWAGFPATGTAYVEHPDGVILGEAPVGQGRVIYTGAFLGEAYFHAESPDFPRFIEWCCQEVPRQGVRLADGYVRTGRSGDRDVAFVFLPPGVTRARLSLEGDFAESTAVEDLLNGARYRPGAELNLVTGPDGIAVLVTQKAPKTLDLPPVTAGHPELDVVHH
jgi:beta-galactosidase